MTAQLAVQPLGSIDEAAAVLTEIREKARAWLLAHIAEDGKPVGADRKNAYYRLPWTLAELGETAAASRVMSWIEREALTDAGDLREGTPRAEFVSKTATYPLTLMAHGAWKLQRYDTARAIMQTLRGMRNPDTGGAFWERPEARSNGYELAYPTAALGMTALMMGQDDIADGAFGWFTRLWAAQPELPGFLYGAWSADGLVTNPSEADVFRCVIDFSKPRQSYFTPGISAAFLTRYFLARGDERARQLALDLLVLHRDATPEQFNYWESMQICKFGLGSAAAYEMDPDGPHLANLLLMADWYRKAQAEDGSWVPSSFLTPQPNPTDALYKTAEHAVWVSYMLAALSGTGRGPVARHEG